MSVRPKLPIDLKKLSDELEALPRHRWYWLLFRLRLSEAKERVRSWLR